MNINRKSWKVIGACTGLAAAIAVIIGAVPTANPVLYGGSFVVAGLVVCWMAVNLYATWRRSFEEKVEASALKRGKIQSLRDQGATVEEIAAATGSSVHDTLATIAEMDRDSLRLTGERDWGRKGFRISLPPRSMKECAAVAAVDAVVLGMWAYIGRAPEFRGAVAFWYLLLALAGAGAAYYLRRAVLIRNNRSAGHTRVDTGIWTVRQVLAFAAIMSLWFRW